MRIYAKLRYARYATLSCAIYMLHYDTSYIRYAALRYVI